MTCFSNCSLDNATLSFFTDRAWSGAISGVYILVSLISFPANGLSLWLLLFRTSPKSPTVVFMINLSLSDLAIGCVLPFHIIYMARGYDWPFSSSMCSATTVLLYANMYCSVLTMTAISVDRYLGIVRPLRLKWSNVGSGQLWAGLGCLTMWAVVLAVLYPLETTDLTYRVSQLNITTCFDVLKWQMLPSLSHWVFYLFIWCVMLFLLPFLVTVLCYARIIRALARESSPKKSRALRLALCVLFVFVLCFAPNNVLLSAHALRRLFHQSSGLYTAYKVSLSLSCLNSCLDPFIYYFACREFRCKLRQMLGLDAEETTVGTQRESVFSARSLSQSHADDNVTWLPIS